MAVVMTSLTHGPNGDWLSRKGIPADIRKEYKAAFAVAFEERFRRPASLSANRAKQEFRDWDATVSSRIEALRAAHRGEGQSLTHKQCHALAGEWYSWFVGQFEEQPGGAEDWDRDAERLADAIEGTETFHEEDDTSPRTPGHQRRVRAAISELARVQTFLVEKGLSLTPESMDALLDAVEDDLIAAFRLRRRRAAGDYGPDARVLRFPKPEWLQPAKLAGLTCWVLFEAWVKERQPAASTVDRWRSVFLALEKRFADRDIATINEDDVIAWKDTLVTEKRSAVVANDIWLTAARTVFRWALQNKKVAANPFKDVRVAVARNAAKLREREFMEHEWQMILSASLAPPPLRMAPYNAVARRWVPWLCAYTGARPGEMTQLRAEDVEIQGDFVAVRITPEAGAVKGGAARTVPLHAHLVEQGFLEFARARQGPLFYDPAARRRERNDPAKPGQAPWIKARDKLAEWVRALGVKDQNISPNHAWRHTFKRRAARARIEGRIRDTMCGHAPKTVGDAYERPTVEDLAEAMKEFPRYEIEPPSAV